MLQLVIMIICGVEYTGFYTQVPWLNQPMNKRCDDFSWAQSVKHVIQVDVIKSDKSSADNRASF